MMRVLACALLLALAGCAAIGLAPPERTTAAGIESARPGKAAKPGETVKAAIALLLANHPEDAEILTLMDPRKESGSDASIVASFLHVLAADRRRQRETAAARIRDERRAQEALRSRADAAQERAAQLQQKLDALTELEKTLSERQPSSSR